MIGGDAGQYRLSQLINKLEDRNHKLQKRIEDLEKVVYELLQSFGEHVIDSNVHKCDE